MADGKDIERRLRYRVVGMIHASRLRPGDRLPSIRQLARETGVDHRAVGRAYRALAAEGLVEIRADSGVYVAGGAARAESANAEERWLAGMLAEGWGRALPRSRLGELLGRCTTIRPVCACVESNEDHLVALAAELEEMFSLEVRPVRVDAHATAAEIAAALPAAAEMVASSVFHAPAAGGAARERGRPFVPLVFNAEFTGELDRRLSQGAVTAVIVDPGFAARGQAYLAVTEHRLRVSYVLVDRLEREGVDPGAPDVLLTRAARRRLGMEEYHLLPPPFRLISEDTALELCAAIVRIALGEPDQCGSRRLRSGTSAPPAGSAERPG